MSIVEDIPLWIGAILALVVIGGAILLAVLMRGERATPYAVAGWVVLTTVGLVIV